MKKIVSILVSTVMLFALVVLPVSADKGNKVTLIVEVEGESLLETKNAVTLGAAQFMATEEAENTETQILSIQSEVKSDIERNIRTVDANDGYTYTGVFNGFSVEAYESDIAKIKAVDGVKNVYVSQSHEIPDEPVVTNTDVQAEAGARMMQVQYMYDHGYDGHGQAVAVIDEEFDTGHEIFSSDISDPKFSKDNIKEFLENNTLNVDVSANQVYKSSKIPFAYDYAEGDADTFLAIGSHGTHVAGITAGKNGNYHGTQFSGVAPEAQLILMKVGTDERALTDEAIMAAFDDAAKLGVCAINFSAGSVQLNDPVMKTVVSAIRNAGIILMSAGGNFNRASETADQPDYCYPNNPALYTDATSVASIDADSVWITEQKILLGNGDTVTYQVEDEVGFFKKFASNPYEYVIFDSVEELEGIDVNDKIWICPSSVVESIASLVQAGMNPAALIVLIESNQDDKGVMLRENMPLIFMREAVREQFNGSEIKTLQTLDSKEYKQIPTDPIMSSFSSWGTTTSLELKPEITAPGGSILSSIPDDKYENKSGTSMAAPHMTGAVALVNAFMEEKYPLVNGTEKVSLMENMFMSSAQIIFQDEDKTLPESPRRQGAGLVDLEAFMKLPVVLIGDSGKSKLSLGDMLTSEIELKFTAKNLTSEDVVYDETQLYVFTDNYQTENGVNYITDSKPLTFSSTAETYTIPANGSREITVTIQLDENQLEENSKIFSNGFYIDGYIVLKSTDGAPKTSMPFTGFYGDWTSFGAIKPSYFESDGGVGGLLGADQNNEQRMLGVNQILDDLVYAGNSNVEDLSEYESADFVGYSPNGDNIFDSMGIELYYTRCLDDTVITVKNLNGDVVWSYENVHGCSRTTNGTLTLDGPSKLPEGDYSLIISGKLDYDSERSYVTEKAFDFYVDVNPPQISNPRVYEEDGKLYAAFSASDNRYLMAVEAFDGENEIAVEPIKALQEKDIVIDVTGANIENLKFVVSDYAYNKNEFTIGNVTAELIGTPVVYGKSVSFNVGITNTTDADVDADIIAAVYSEDGRLIEVETQKEELVSGKSLLKAFSFESASSYKYAKLFIWKHGEMIPLMKEPLKIE